jgi:single-strand DNA-binding protein
VQNINVVAITGNLTKDPELRTTRSDTYVCDMRVAVNARRKEGEEWVDKPNFIDVAVFGKHGAACAEHLAKGKPVAVQGRLDWSEWEAKDGNGRRQRIQIIADTVQFLGTGQGSKGGEAPEAESEGPAEVAEVVGAAVGGGDEDIPF